jgi:triacylglycerol lipase
MNGKNLMISAVLCASCLAVPFSYAATGEAACGKTEADYTKTKYPVVFVHGMGGYSSLDQNTQYWYKIPQDIRLCGGTQVFETDLSAFNNEEVRGEQLRKQVEAILAATNAEKVNLIAHSQGGLTARYLGKVYPHYVASITTIGTPHKGSTAADFGNWIGLTRLMVGKNNDKGSAMSQQADSFKTLQDLGSFSDAKDIQAMGSDAAAAQLLEDFKNAQKNGKNVTVALQDLDNFNGAKDLEAMKLPQDSAAAYKQVSSKGASEFNKKYPSDGVPEKCNGKGKPYDEYVLKKGNEKKSYKQYLYSWTGNRVLTAPLKDPQDKLLLASSAAFLNLPLIENNENDGLVSVCSSNFGERIGIYKWNHGDEINATRGLVGNAEESPVTIIRTHVNRLKNKGL